MPGFQPCQVMFPGWKLPQLGAERLGEPTALAFLVVRKTRTWWCGSWKAPAPLQAVAVARGTEESRHSHPPCLGMRERLEWTHLPVNRKSGKTPGNRPDESLLSPPFWIQWPLRNITPITRLAWEFHISLLPAFPLPGAHPETHPAAFPLHLKKTPSSFYLNHLNLEGSCRTEAF